MPSAGLSRHKVLAQPPSAGLVIVDDRRVLRRGWARVGGGRARPGRTGGAGVSSEEVPKRLGHSSVAITLSLDAHVFEPADRAAADLTVRAMNGP